MQLPHHKPSGVQTERVATALLRFIHDQNLSSGDRLPSQQALRKELHVGGTPIAAAIEQLAQDGVVRIVDKVGVFVQNHDLSGLAARQVVVLSNPITFSPFNAALFFYVNSLLQKFGAQCIFVERDRSCQLSLRRLLKSRRLDALLNLSDISRELAEQFHRHNIPIFSCNSAKVTYLATGAVCNDTAWNFQAMFRCLEEQGCRKIWGIAGVTANEEDAYRQACQALPNRPECHIQFVSMPEMRDITPAQQEDYFKGLLDLAIREKPDGIAVLDDIAATRLFAKLRCATSNYDPFITVLCNRQIPCVLPYPNVVYFQNDIEALASNTVKMMEKYWQGKWTEGTVELYRSIPRE